MEMREMIGRLLEGADEHADTLHLLVEETLDDDNPEAHEQYTEMLAELEGAIEAARAFLREKTP